MALKNRIQKRVLILIGLVLAAVLIVAFVQTQDRFDSAEQAVQSGEESLVIQPVYEADDRALFFFLHGSESFGAASATDSLFGWKLDWRSENSVPGERDPDRIMNYMSHEDGFVYGLFDAADERLVEVAGLPADEFALDLHFPEQLLADAGLTGMSVWFSENAPTERPMTLRLLDEEEQELHRLEMY